MKITIAFLVVLFAAFAVQSGWAVPHPHHKLHKAATVAAGAGALALKPKVIAGGALVGGALLGKKLVAGALIGKALLLKKPVLIAGGLVAAKLAKKALLVGAGALAAKKLISAIRAKKPCRRTCTKCSRTKTVESAHREVVREEVREPAVKEVVQEAPQVQEETRKIEKRSIGDIVRRGIENVSTRIESAGTRLSNFGDSVRRGGERMRDVTNDSRLIGGFIADTIRARASGLLN